MMKLQVKNYLSRYFGLFVRSIDSGNLMETFLVSAVSSLLLIRAYLNFTGYPQIGAGEFHIAHMLFGGFLMLLALILAATFLNKDAKRLSMVVGGVGFGAFIDELGKFITSNNDYFYQPSIALIYVIFILIFFLSRLVERFVKISQTDYAINALEVAKDVVIYDLNEQEKKRALQFLEKSNSDDPLVKDLKQLFNSIQAEESKMGPIGKTRRWLSRHYFQLVAAPWFSNALIIIFVAFSAWTLLDIIWEIKILPTFAQWGQLIFSAVSILFVLAGAYLMLEKKRLHAYQMFRRALLVSIFLTQFFLFLEDQLSATVVLAVNLIFYLSIRYMISEEKAEES